MCVTIVNDSSRLPSFHETVSRTSRTPFLICSPSRVICAWSPCASGRARDDGLRAALALLRLGRREQLLEAALAAGEHLQDPLRRELHLRLHHLGRPAHLRVALLLERALLPSSKSRKPLRSYSDSSSTILPRASSVATELARAHVVPERAATISETVSSAAARIASAIITSSSVNPRFAARSLTHLHVPRDDARAAGERLEHDREAVRAVDERHVRPLRLPPREEVDVRGPSSRAPRRPSTFTGPNRVLPGSSRFFTTRSRARRTPSARGAAGSPRRAPGEAVGERLGALGIARDPGPPRRALRPPRAAVEVERHAAGGVAERGDVEERPHRAGELARRLARVGARDRAERGDDEGRREGDHAEDDEELDEREAAGLWAGAPQAAPSS